MIQATSNYLDKNRLIFRRNIFAKHAASTAFKRANYLEIVNSSYRPFRIIHDFVISGLLRSVKISNSEEWSSLGEEANGGGTNNNEATNNLHLLAASAGLNEDGGDDSDSAKETPKKRRRNSDGKMQTDVVRVPGLSSDLQQQITKFDSSEFDVSLTILMAGPLFQTIKKHEASG